MFGWSELPYDVLVLIANKLLDVADFISFSIVCRHWNMVYLRKEWNCSRTSPWVMLNRTDVGKRRFFSFSSLKCYSLPVQEPHDCRCWGTSRGWIAMFSQDFFLRLFNPLTRVHITHPSLEQIIGKSYYHWFSAVEKAAVFSLHGEIVTMIIYSGKLSLTRHGADYWATVKFPTTVILSDVVCFNNQILAVTMSGMLMLVDMNTPSHPPSHPIKAYFAASPPEGETGWSNLYLVESQGRLLLVLYFNGDSWNKFKVYELDVSQGKWILIYDLGGQSLLIDDYSCTSISANGCFKHNCIYHLSDNSLSMLDYLSQQTWLTVYNVKDKTSESVWICKHSLVYSCPLWIMPALW